LRVTLVNTFHGERGAVTVAALVKLLDRLTPDVVFAEIPRANAASYADGSHGNLEALAVAELRQRRQVTVVPVDRNEPSEEFFRVTRELFDRVERTSRDYCSLVDRHSDQTTHGGLRYLNSAESVEAHSAIRREVRDTIDWMRAPALHEVYDMWLREIELRDEEMLANISQFAAANARSRGVFLVGAAHRQSILNKIQLQRDRGLSAIEWQVELPSAMFD
jgi:hypothetical protein